MSGSQGNPMTSSLPAETRIPAPVQLTAALLRSWALPSDPDDGKFERGTVMVVGGPLVLLDRCSSRAKPLSGLEPGGFRSQPSSRQCRR
jgi:hypothetical protein